MKIALITDTHYGIRNDSPVFYDYFKKFNQKFFDVIDDHKITRVIHLGDLYDRRKYINFVTAKRCREDFLDELRKRNLQVEILAGNHDTYYKNTSEVSSLNELLHGYPFDVVMKAKEIEIDDTSILLVPWINEQNYFETIEAIKNSKAHICFGHLELSGFEMYRGVVCDDGMDKSLFDKFDIVASGHFHHKSIRGNIHYLGAAYEFTWSDYADDRGFHIFDTETRAFEFIKNPNTMFHMLAYDDVKNEKKIQEQIKKADFSRLTDTYVKVVCMKRTNPYLFDLFIDKIYKASPIDISVIEDISAFVEISESSEILQAQDTLTILDSYIDGLQMELDNDRMKQLMKSIYSEAIALEDTFD